MSVVVFENCTHKAKKFNLWQNKRNSKGMSKLRFLCFTFKIKIQNTLRRRKKSFIFKVVRYFNRQNRGLIIRLMQTKEKKRSYNVGKIEKMVVTLQGYFCTNW